MKKILASVCCIVLAILMLLPAVAAPTNDDILAAALIIIRENEGTYTSVNADDNGALSIGYLQWHAGRALSLLRDIIDRNDANAKSILGDTLYNEITDTSTVWTERVLTDSEVTVIATLLGTDEGKAAQDELASANVLTYITHGQTLGINSPSALVYFADLENQCGSGGATRVANSAIALAGDGTVTLEILHTAALADTAAGKYSSRRNKVYNYALLLGWESDQSGEQYEIWKTLATLNVRSGPGTTYDAVTSYSTGTYIAVYEKTTVGETTWGRTPAGWVSLAYCSYITNPFDTISANTRSLSFDAAGGTLSTEPKGTLTVNVVNGYRATNYLAVYTPAHGDTSGTNKYGAELTVDANGMVTCEAVKSVGNLTIPEGGLVVSAHGTAIAKLQALAAVGNYIYFDSESMTVEVYETESEYLAAHKTVTFGEPYGALPTPTAPNEDLTFTGWYTNGGELITSDTAVLEEHSSTLVAGWKGMEYKVNFDLNGGYFETASSVSHEVNGVNITRGDGALVVYNSDSGNTSSGTNKWGVDIAIPADGIVTEDPVINTYNLTIPEGDFVLSGHNTSCTWILNNISKGCYVKFDSEAMTVTVWSSYSDYIGPEKTFMYGLPIGTLPTPVKDGDTFICWVDASGNTVTEDTLISTREEITLTAKWEGDRIPGDVDGNGRANLRDMYALLYILKGKTSADGYNPDVDGNGRVSINDIFYLKSIIIARD